MFGLIFSTPNKSEKLLFGYLWVISQFFLLFKILFWKTHPYHISNSWREDPEKTKIFNNKVKLSHIVWNEWYCPIIIFWRKYILEIFFTNFPVFKNTIIRIAFENAYESSINFQPFYMPTFLPNFRLMRPLSLAFLLYHQHDQILEKQSLPWGYWNFNISYNLLCLHNHRSTLSSKDRFLKVTIWLVWSHPSTNISAPGVIKNLKNL